LLVAPASRDFVAEADAGVMICHVPPGDPASRHPMVVGTRALQNHLEKHGDWVGPCDDIIPQ
jgi:hypothetical protein